MTIRCFKAIRVDCFLFFRILGNAQMRKLLDDGEVCLDVNGWVMNVSVSDLMLVVLIVSIYMLLFWPRSYE